MEKLDIVNMLLKLREALLSNSSYWVAGCQEATVGTDINCLKAAQELALVLWEAIKLLLENG